MATRFYRSSRQPVRTGIPALVIHWVVRLRLLWIILLAFLFLSGCRYQVGVTFTDANHGAIVQQVHLSQLTGVNRATAQLWLEKLSAETQQIGGKIQHPNERDWVMTIPFYNAKDLVTKFDLLLRPLTTELQPHRSHPQQSGSQLHIATNNLILCQRHRLTYDLDLRSLKPTDSTPLLPPLPSFEFALNTPWGARHPQSEQFSRPLVWMLQPGEINHLEALFWVPSPIGIGLFLIVILVITGMFLKAWRNPTSLIELPPDP